MPMIDAVVNDRVLVVRIDNRTANALTSDMAGMLETLAKQAGTREDIGAVLVTGAHNRNFCGGSDIRELARLNDAGQGPGPLLEAEAAAFTALASLDIPTIAAIDGAAAGGGLELAVCCDVIVASEAARFSLPEIKLGVFPALGGTVRLVRRIGEARALEMMLTGATIDASKALSWGLVNQVVPKGRGYETARLLAGELARGPKQAIKGLKEALRYNRHATEKKALDFALDLALRHSASGEVKEGLAAFASGEEPDFADLSHVHRSQKA